MKRPSQAAASPKGQWACPDTAFKKSYPHLAAGLCDSWWDDGKPRTPWTLTVRMDDTSVNLCINDKDANMGAYTSGGSLSEALALVEAALDKGALSWRKWRK